MHILIHNPRFMCCELGCAPQNILLFSRAFSSSLMIWQTCVKTAAHIVPLCWMINVWLHYTTSSLNNSSRVAHELTKRNFRICKNNTWVRVFSLHLVVSQNTQAASKFKLCYYDIIKELILVVFAFLLETKLIKTHVPKNAAKERKN